MQPGSNTPVGSARLMLSLLALGAVLALSFPPAWAAGPAASEYALKAAIVYKLTKFVSWPDSVFPGEDEPLLICLDGGSPYESAMIALDGRSVQGRIVSVRSLTGDNGSYGSCHVVFISEGQEHLLELVSGKPVLTIGEGNTFVQRGGIIGLRVEENHVGFLVNVEASEYARINISARLLQLATIVKVNGG